MAKLKDVIYLSNTDYDTLVSTGTVTIGSDVLTYDENNLYVTPEKVATTTEDGLMSSADKAKLDGLATSVTVTGSGNVVSAATYNTASHTIELTKGVTALTAVKQLVTTATGGLGPGTETLSGAGNINLHRVSKTGSYGDLRDVPWKKRKDDDGYYTVYAPNANANVPGCLEIDDNLNAPVSRPSNVIAFSDPDVYIYGTGITIHDGDDDSLVQLSYPSHSGTIATEDQLGLDLLDLRYAT